MLKVKMKILKAKRNYLNKQIFQISDLTYITRMTPLKELLNGEDMIEPIKVLKHDTRKIPIGPLGEELFDYSKYRSGAGDSNFKENNSVYGKVIKEFRPLYNWVTHT